mmetsp:Transcript_47282/g.147821  ORF Transcript_47282/g.147821 Transcript_47282/m.147821 type:complete len:210 (-) Transcript_47282:2392-3021(-)
MDGWTSSGRRSCRISTDVEGFFTVKITKGCGDARLHVTPSSLVERLLLHPEDLCIGVSDRHLPDTVVGEGANLLDPHDSHILYIALVSLRSQVVIHSSRTENKSLNFFVGNDVLKAVRQNPLESLVVVEIQEIGLALRMTKERLGADADQRLAEISADLSSQQVEVVGGGGRIDDLHVDILDLSHPCVLHLRNVIRVIVTHLKVSLQPC